MLDHLHTGGTSAQNRAARHFHARGGAKGKMQTPLRENTIDYERIVGVLEANGYDGFVCVEYVYGEFSPLIHDVDVLSETVVLRDLLRTWAGGP